jgi:nitrogen regulatory protein PII
MKLVILITAKTEKGLEVAEAWQEAGAPGITILRSYGLYTLQERVRRGDVELPRMVMSMASAMAAVLENVEQTTSLMLSVVPHEMVDVLIEATSRVLGDLLSPDSGVIFVLDIERAIGVRDHSKPD